jgi:hypothetical protein
MLSRLLLGSLFLVALSGQRGPQPTTPLPPEWLGTWSGKLLIHGSAAKPTEVSMSLKIEPIKGTTEATWVITYGDGDKASVRDYKLVPDGDKPGRFKIDERNGIILDIRLTGSVMHSQFEVGGNLIMARYELRGDTLRLEFTSAKPAAEKTGKGQVLSYPVDTVQTAELKKK